MSLRSSGASHRRYYSLALDSIQPDALDRLESDPRRKGWTPAVIEASADIRRAALEALAVFSCDALWRIIPAISSAAGEPDDQVRAIAEKILRAISSQNTHHVDWSRRSGEAQLRRASARIRKVCRCLAVSCDCFPDFPSCPSKMLGLLSIHNLFRLRCLACFLSIVCFV